MNEEIANQIEDNFDELPSEVKEFVFGEGMDKVSAELAAIVTDEQQSLILKNNIYQYLLGVMRFEEINQFIDNLPTEDEKKITIKKIIQEKIIDELLLLMEVHQDMEGDTQPKAVPVEQAPNPSQVIESLRGRLTEARSIAPSSRNLSVNPTTQTAKPSIDPYREMPEI